VNVEDDTWEIPLDEPEEDGGAQPEPDLGPWGAEAVQLDERSRDRMSIGNGARRPQSNPRRWIALAAVACAASVFSVLGALTLSGSSTTKEIGSRKAPKTSRQPPVAERMPNGARAAHRARQRRRQALRRASHRHRAVQLQTARPAPSLAHVTTFPPTQGPGRGGAPPPPGPRRPSPHRRPSRTPHRARPSPRSSASSGRQALHSVSATQGSVPSSPSRPQHNPWLCGARAAPTRASRPSAATPS
jgi:hypothetical protein